MCTISSFLQELYGDQSKSVIYFQKTYAPIDILFSILQVYLPNSKGDAIIFQCPVCPL